MLLLTLLLLSGYTGKGCRNSCCCCSQGGQLLVLLLLLRLKQWRTVAGLSCEDCRHGGRCIAALVVLLLKLLGWNSHARDGSGGGGTAHTAGQVNRTGRVAAGAVIAAASTSGACAARRFAVAAQ